MSDLPGNFTETRLDRVPGTTMCGREIADLSRDDLLATVIYLMEAQDGMRRQYRSDLDTLADIRARVR